MRGKLSHWLKHIIKLQSLKLSDTVKKKKKVEDISIDQNRKPINRPKVYI